MNDGEEQVMALSPFQPHLRRFSWHSPPTVYVINDKMQSEETF